MLADKGSIILIKMYLAVKSVVRSALDPSSKESDHGITPLCRHHVTQTTLYDIPQGDAASAVRSDITATLPESV
jgi:hypothetical protein